MKPLNFNEMDIYKACKCQAFGTPTGLDSVTVWNSDWSLAPWNLGDRVWATKYMIQMTEDHWCSLSEDPITLTV